MLLFLPVQLEQQRKRFCQDIGYFILLLLNKSASDTYTDVDQYRHSNALYTNVDHYRHSNALFPVYHSVYLNLTAQH